MAMKKYNVTVNGNRYEVTVEETAGDGIAPSVPAASAPAKVASVSEAQPRETSPAKAVPSGDGAPITAPLNGTVLKVNVAVNDAVKKGDVLCILEAMKMENEIMAPKDGKVTSVAIAKGGSVNAGDVLFTIA